MELKVHKIQKNLINKHMTPKREKARKKIIDEDTTMLFAEILHKQINKMKRGL